MRRAVAVVVVAVCGGLGLGAVACSADGDAPTAADGMRARLQRSTLFETQRALHLAVGLDQDDEGDGDRDVTIGTIQLDSPLFEPVPPQPRDALVRASDRNVVMPLRFGTARCDGEADEPAELVAEVDGDEVRVAIHESPAGMLAALHTAECAAAAVRAEVDLRLGDRWERTAPRTVEGDIEIVQRRPGATVAVDEIEGNVIFFVHSDDGPGPWLEVSDDRPLARGRVAIEAARCDPHALTEYKRTFIFVAWVGIDGGDPVRVDIEAEGETQRILAELLAACLD